jgi:hypothetical protein
MPENTTGKTAPFLAIVGVDSTFVSTIKTGQRSTFFTVEMFPDNRRKRSGRTDPLLSDSSHFEIVDYH